ncbi:MAG TPA: peptidylprolyl isomerase [Flavisolibacter sp.]|nr:peptidylprolyl isomerase [Flavisolibacter sp.]
MKKIAFVLFSIIGLTSVAMAQPKKLVADKILGIVGDRIILYSDIQNTIGDLARQGGTVPEHAECTFLEQALISKVLMLQAEKDSLPVTDDDVEAELDQKLRYFISQYGSKEVLEQMAGKTVYQIKDDARASVKEQKLAEAMQRKIVENVKITPTEVKAYFDKIPKDSLPFFETQVEIGQIVVYPKSSRDLEKYVQDELANYKKQIEAKQITFEQAAAKYSEDKGTQEHGGLFSMNRNDKNVDPTFLAAAFRLKDGEISSVIKSKFGYHIIQMVKRSGDDATVRHILRSAPITDVETNESIAKLDSVRSKLIAGTIDFNAAAGRYSEDEAAKFSGPFIISRDGDTYNTIDELDKDVVAMLDKLKVGEYSQPTVFTDERSGKKGVRILYLKSRTEPHRMNIRDDYNRIATAALEQKKYIALDKWLTTHIPSYYIMVDQDEASCPQLQKWVNVGKTYASVK